MLPATQGARPEHSRRLKLGHRENTPPYQPTWALDDNLEFRVSEEVTKEATSH